MTKQNLAPKNKKQNNPQHVLVPQQAKPKPTANKSQAHGKHAHQWQTHKSPLKKCRVDVTVIPISSKPITKFHKPTTHPHQQKNLNHPATTPKQPTTKTHSLSPMKTHIKTHPPLWGLWKIKHCLRWQGKREVEKNYGKEIWCAMERKSESSMPWKGFLKIKAHGEEIKAREEREKLDIGHNIFPIWMKFFPLVYLLTS